MVAVKDGVFQYLELVGRDVRVSHLRRRVHDAEVHSRFGGVVKEHGVHGLAYIVVATEREAQVAHAAAHVRALEVLANPSRGADKLQGIAVVLFNACGYRQDVGVEDYVERVHAHIFRQQLVGAAGYLHPPLIGRGLSLLVEAHHHDSRAEASHVAGVGEKDVFAFLQRDGVHDAFALQAFQSGCHHVPFR